jgi:predicted nucleotidyltransferase
MASRKERLMSTTPETKRNEPSLTPAKSSASVRTFWLDQKKIVARLGKATISLANRHLEIKRVILFGSLVRGEAAPGSDADLLIVLDKSDIPFLSRSARYQPAPVGVGVDLFAYTEAELEKMLADGNPFISRALAEGITLFP